VISRAPCFDLKGVRRFYILFEVDRSYNGNTNFPKDRPSVLYKSPLIDLDNLQSRYALSPAGWMCNATVGAAYVWVPEPQYIADTGGSYDNMIFSITATVEMEKD